MTLEELKKHIRPLVWEAEEGSDVYKAVNCIDPAMYIFPNTDGTWYSYADGYNHSTREEAEKSAEEYHLQELEKYFILDEEN